MGLVVILAVVLHYAYRPTRSADGAAATSAETSGAVAISAPGSTFPRELVEMEAAGLVTLARPNVVPSTALRPMFPRELVEMEAAGLVTLARP